jgi:glycosyltransferase involved in cell wall biosynthesis
MGVAPRSSPLVSIIVTSYNYERFVGAAIASALAQSYEPVEVIVVDDGSTDRSRDIIRRFAGGVRVILQENAGETAATNSGFAAARGDIVIFMDSDDALRPDAVATAAPAFCPGVAAVQWQLQSIDGQGRPFGGVFPNFRRSRTPAQVRSEALRCGLYACSPSSGCAYSRAFLRQVLPLSAEIFRHGPDGPINAVAPLYGDVVTIEQPLSFYRIHGRNMWAQHDLRPDDFPRYIAWDRRRVAYFRAHAEALGLAPPDDLLDRALFHLQYRMASLRLRRDSHPVSGDSRLRLLRLAVAAAISTSQEHPLVRLAALGWLAMLVLAPSRQIPRLVALRFIGGRRAALLQRLACAFGLSRAAAPQPGGTPICIPPPEPRDVASIAGTGCCDARSVVSVYARLSSN